MELLRFRGQSIAVVVCCGGDVAARWTILS